MSRWHTHDLKHLRRGGVLKFPEDAEDLYRTPVVFFDDIPFDLLEERKRRLEAEEGTREWYLVTDCAGEWTEGLRGDYGILISVVDDLAAAEAELRAVNPETEGQFLESESLAHVRFLLDEGLLKFHGDVEKNPLMPFIWKELRVAGMMALLLAIIAFGDALLISGMEDNDEPFSSVIYAGLVIGLAMFAHVLTAALLGALTPLVVKKFRGDPAMISTPAVTAIADLTGAAIYLVLVTLML